MPFSFPFHTPTLARVLLAQGRFDAADEVIEALSNRRCPEAEELLTLRRRNRLEKFLLNVQKRKSHGSPGGTDEDR